MLSIVTRELIGPSELPVAVGPRALVRLLARMRPIVLLEVRALEIRLGAARKRALKIARSSGARVGRGRGRGGGGSGGGGEEQWIWRESGRAAAVGDIVDGQIEIEGGIGGGGARGEPAVVEGRGDGRGRVLAEAVIGLGRDERVGERRGEVVGREEAVRVRGLDLDGHALAILHGRRRRCRRRSRSSHSSIGCCSNAHEFRLARATALFVFNRTRVVVVVAVLVIVLVIVLVVLVLIRVHVVFDMVQGDDARLLDHRLVLDELKFQQNNF